MRGIMEERRAEARALMPLLGTRTDATTVGVKSPVFVTDTSKEPSRTM